MWLGYTLLMSGKLNVLYNEHYMFKFFIASLGIMLLHVWEANGVSLKQHSYTPAKRISAIHFLNRNKVF